MAKLKPADFKAITQYRYGLLPRRPAHIPHISAADDTLYVKTRWDNFDLWMAWQDKGKPSPRPSNVWKIVPQWDDGYYTPWDLRRDIIHKRPQHLPIPPHFPVPPIPPLPAAAARWQYAFYGGGNPMLGLEWPHSRLILFTADPNASYDSQATRENADRCRHAGREIGVWYVPTQVDLSRAKSVADRLGVSFDMISGQAETIDEFRQSWNNGHRHVVGNLSACVNDADAVHKIQTGEMLFSNEFYWNQSKGRRPDNHNLPVVCLVVAVYDGHSDSQESDAWNPNVVDYKAAGYLPDGSGLYEPGADIDDVRNMP